MKNEEIKRRIDDVMKTDATVANEADFMLTHMPFKRLANYKRSEERISGHNLLKEDDYSKENRFDENSVFSDFIKEDNRHEFYMIIGKNGSGKSHLIRWMYFQIIKHYREIGDDKEKVIFISRAHNNLKDALKTILDSNVLSEERIQYYLNRIGGGVSSASEEELKDIIVSNLRIGAKYAETKGLLDSISYKKLLCFLEDKGIEQNFLRKEDGPVDRIYCALTKSEKKVSGDPFEEALFLFTKTDINQLMHAKERPANEIIKFVTDLARDKKLRNDVVKYLSALETTVIERTSSISGADVRSIFEEIRKELYSEDKKLTLLIEDINVYKGVDSALVEVLIQEHDDINGLCRLKSIVGSTDRYFDDYFNGALYQRMTRKIVILEKTLLEDKTKLVEFAARYINAIHFSKEEVSLWYKGEREFPLWKNNYMFSKVKVDDKEYSIFPFNANAIINLFECLSFDARTPREFLKSVVKAGQQLWFDYGKNMIDKKTYFTENEGISRINGFIEEEDKDRFDGKKYADFERRELLFLLWGDRTFKLDESGNVITCIDKDVFEVFGVDFEGKIGEVDKKDDPQKQENEKKPKEKVVQEKNAKEEVYQRTVKYILDWQDGIEQELIPHKDARDHIKDFVLKNIDWENEKVPYTFAKEYINKIQNYVIEGSEENEAKILIRRNNLSAGMMRALFEQKTFSAGNTWAFGENDYQSGIRAQIIAKTWLLVNRDEIIEKTKKAIFVDEDIKQWALEARICDLIIQGKLKGWSPEDIYEALFKCSNKSFGVRKKGYHWSSLTAFFEKNSDCIRTVFDSFFVNTVGITPPDSEKDEYKIMDSVEIMERIVIARQNIAFGKRKSKLKSVDERINIMSQAVVMFSEKMQECIQEDVVFANKHLNKFVAWFGKGANEKIVNSTIKSMREYLYDMRSRNQMFKVNMIEKIEEPNSSKEIVDIVKQLQLVVSVKEAFEVAVICGSLNNERINEIAQTFDDFERFMHERTAIFKSKIDMSLDKKIVSVQKEIENLIDNCIEKVGEK